jgi:hypothetical protein
MKRLLIISLLIAAAVSTSGFFVALSFNEKCKKADLIVRAVVLRTVEFFPKSDEYDRSREIVIDRVPTTKVQILRVVEVAKGDADAIPALIYLPGGYTSEFGETPPDFPQGTDVVVFLRKMGEGYYALLDSLSYDVVRGDKVVPERPVNLPKDVDEWTFWQKYGMSTRAYIDGIKNTIKKGYLCPDVMVNQLGLLNRFHS